MRVRVEKKVQQENVGRKVICEFLDVLGDCLSKSRKIQKIFYSKFKSRLIAVEFLLRFW